MTDVTPYLASAVTAELEDWGPLEEATGEEMSTSGLTLWKDGDQEAGVWECTPGPSYWKLETHEFVQIIAGRMTVTPDGGEPMRTSGITLWQDGEQESGVWECTPGPSYWKLETNEFVHIVSGRMTVTPDGGAPQEIGPGDTAVFPRGWAGTWQIHETIRKLYVIF